MVMAIPIKLNNPPSMLGRTNSAMMATIIRVVVLFIFLFITQNKTFWAINCCIFYEMAFLFDYRWLNRCSG